VARVYDKLDSPPGAILRDSCGNALWRTLPAGLRVRAADDLSRFFLALTPRSVGAVLVFRLTAGRVVGASAVNLPPLIFMVVARRASIRLAGIVEESANMAFACADF